MQVYFESFSFHRDGTVHVYFHHPFRTLVMKLDELIQQSTHSSQTDEKYIKIKALFEYRTIDPLRESKIPLLIECEPTDSMTSTIAQGGIWNNADTYGESFILSRGEFQNIIQTAKHIAQVHDLRLPSNMLKS